MDPHARSSNERASAVSHDKNVIVLGGAVRQDSISYTSRTVHIKLRSDTEIFYSPTGDPVLSTTLMKCPL